MPFLITGIDKGTKQPVKTVSNAPNEVLARKSADALGIQVESIVVVEQPANVRQNHQRPIADEPTGEINGEPAIPAGDGSKSSPEERERSPAASKPASSLCVLVTVAFALIAMLPWLDGVLGKGDLGWGVRTYASVTFLTISVAVILWSGEVVPEIQAQQRWNAWGLAALLFTICSAVQFYVMEYTLSGLGEDLFTSPFKFAVVESIYFTAPLLASVCALMGLIRIRQLGRLRPEGWTCKLALAFMAVFGVWCAVSFYSFAGSLDRFNTLSASLNNYAINHRCFPHSLSDLPGTQAADSSIAELIPDVQFDQQVEYETQFIGLHSTGHRIVLFLTKVTDGRRYAYTSDRKVVHFSMEREFGNVLDASRHPVIHSSNY